jgi:hypothetical protein
MDMRDDRTLAFINLHAILGSLVWLCKLDEQARSLIADKKISLGITVKNGPSATLSFDHGQCSITPQVESCDIKLAFSTCAKFNGMIDGTVTPIPIKGFTKIGFLTKQFTALTNMLTNYLRPDPQALEDKEFFRTSTLLMFHLIVEAIAQIGNEDKIGRASASYIQDGLVQLAIRDGLQLGVMAKDHRLTALHQDLPRRPMSYMEFASLELARDLFDGKINAVASVGQGQIRIGGMISQIDNVNRILDRVAVYLA